MWASGVAAWSVHGTALQGNSTCADQQGSWPTGWECSGHSPPKALGLVIPSHPSEGDLPPAEPSYKGTLLAQTVEPSPMQQEHLAVNPHEAALGKLCKREREKIKQVRKKSPDLSAAHNWVLLHSERCTQSNWVSLSFYWGHSYRRFWKSKELLGPTRMPKWCYRHPEEERTACKIPGLRNKYLGKWQYIVILLMAEPLVGFV